VPPAQAGEPGVVAVGSDPLAARFDRERSKVGVRHEVASGSGFPAKPGKDVPVPLARFDLDGRGLLAEGIAELERVLDRVGIGEAARMGDDSDEAAQNELADPERFVGADSLDEPAPVRLVLARVRPIGVDQDADVTQADRPPP
jgi:hypothetical protein